MKWNKIKLLRNLIWSDFLSFANNIIINNSGTVLIKKYYTHTHIFTFMSNNWRTTRVQKNKKKKDGRNEGEEEEKNSCLKKTKEQQGKEKFSIIEWTALYILISWFRWEREIMFSLLFSFKSNRILYSGPFIIKRIERKSEWVSKGIPVLVPSCLTQFTSPLMMMIWWRRKHVCVFDCFVGWKWEDKKIKM